MTTKTAPLSPSALVASLSPVELIALSDLRSAYLSAVREDGQGTAIVAGATPNVPAVSRKDTVTALAKRGLLSIKDGTYKFSARGRGLFVSFFDSPLLVGSEDTAPESEVPAEPASASFDTTTAAGQSALLRTLDSAPVSALSPAEGLLSPAPAPTAPRSYKVACKTKSDSEWVYNALRFRTAEEATIYGRDLHSRWLGLDKWEVHPSEDAPNYYITPQGGALPIPAGGIPAPSPLPSAAPAPTMSTETSAPTPTKVPTVAAKPTLAPASKPAPAKKTPEQIKAEMAAVKAAASMTDAQLAAARRAQEKGAAPSLAISGSGPAPVLTPTPAASPAPAPAKPQPPKRGRNSKPATAAAGLLAASEARHEKESAPSAPAPSVAPVSSPVVLADPKPQHGTVLPSGLPLPGPVTVTGTRPAPRPQPSKPAPKKSAATSTPGAGKKTGLRKGQIRVLEYLKDQIVGRTRREISDGAKVDNASLSGLIGAFDPEKRQKDDVNQYMSLISLGFVIFGQEDRDGKDVMLHSITEAGRKALATLSA